MFDMMYEEIEIKDINAEVFEKFIMEEIEPYLSISLSKKLTVPSLHDFCLKTIDLADGYVFVSKGIIIGVATAYIRNRYTNNVYLNMLGVARFYRKKGIGTRLLLKIINDLPEGCNLVTNVDAENKEAFKFYRKMGFISKKIDKGRMTIEYKNPNT